jgi:hypothetical protein
MRKRFVLAIFALCLLAASLAHAESIVPWMSGNFTNVPDIFTFSHTSVSPDGKRDFNLDLNLTVGTPVVINQQFCGGVLCYEERSAPITGTVTGTITDVMTGVVEQTMNLRPPVFAVADFQDWFPPNPAEHEYEWEFLFVGDWPNSFETLIGGRKIDSSTQPDVSIVAVKTFTPEPATLVTLASSLLGVGFIRYRRHQRHFM